MYYKFESPDIDDHIYLKGTLVEKRTPYTELSLIDGSAAVETVVWARFPDANFLQVLKFQSELNNLKESGYEKIGISSDGMRLLVAYNGSDWRLIEFGGLKALKSIDTLNSVIITKNEFEFKPARKIDDQHLKYIYALSNHRYSGSLKGDMSRFKTTVKVCGLSVLAHECPLLPEDAAIAEKVFEENVARCVSWIEAKGEIHTTDAIELFIRDNDFVEPFGGLCNIKLNNSEVALELSSSFSYEVYEAALNVIAER